MPDTAPGWSLQRRLRRRLLAVLAAGWLLGTAAALLGLWRETDEVLDSALVATARRLLLLPDAALGDTADPALVADADDSGDYVSYQLSNADGVMRLRSHAAPLQPLDAGAPDGLRNVGPWHVLTMTRADGQRRAQVAETRSHRYEVLWNSVGWLLGALLAVLPVAALGLRAVLAQGFRTLEPVRRELVQREAHDLRPLGRHDLPDELAPWLQGMNALIARAQALVDGERAFAAHTAHELRTPLAAARAQAQRLAAVAGDAAVRQHAEALVRQLDRLTRLAARLLQLARIESGVALQREPVDIAQLAALVADEFGEACRQQRLRIDANATPQPVLGDVDALGIALRNLVDNALKHGGPQATVVIAVGADSLSVSDDGPGVPAASLAGLVRKFERGSGSAEGCGLGLAMVDTIARQSGARLLLQSPLHDGRGFCAQLLFATDGRR